MLKFSITGCGVVVTGKTQVDVHRITRRTEDKARACHNHDSACENV